MPVEPIQTIQERSRHIQKESEYVKMLRDGSGVTGERSRLGVQRILPAGMRGVNVVPENVENSVVEEYVMATVIESAEGSPQALRLAQMGRSYSKGVEYA